MSLPSKPVKVYSHCDGARAKSRSSGHIMDVPTTMQAGEIVMMMCLKKNCMKIKVAGSIR